MDNWNYHDKKMKELKQLYLKTSKQTQNTLQEIIDTFKFDFDTLYNVADTKTKKRVNTYIEEWKDKGLLTGYFGTLAKSIYGRTRVKNSEIFELLIYSAYVEEQEKLKEQELNIMYDDANYYYQEGQQEVYDTLPKKEKKSPSILKWALFLALLDEPNVKGYIFEQYIQATIQFNVQQIYRQITIDLQQQNEIDITNDIYQSIIKRQNNFKLNINGDKISGDIDAQLIEVNNLAKVEGIKEVDNNAQVRFIAVIDGKETDMCHSLDGQLFYINKKNEFNRYYGETQKDLRIEKIKCFGLVIGLNLPPISHHFHWCRSTITYQVPKEDISLNTKYNIFSNKTEKQIERKYNINKVRMKGVDKKLLNNILTNMNKVYNDFPQVKGQIKEIQSISHPYGGLNITPDIKDDKYIMQINRNKFNDEKMTEKEYNRDLKSGFHPKGTTYKDMGIHELGHCVTYKIIRNKYSTPKQIANDWNKNITSKEIVEKSFKNLGISDKLTKDILRKQISNYTSIDYGETIGEAFADYYANGKNSKSLSKEIIKVMKGMI
ncbi:MAG: hypothetical protein UE116_06350 [Clostridia bacterium]|nr:hypothetical protein [Clostridia bacterium]